MNSWETVQSDPEKFGLTTIGEIEMGGSYEFDTLVVWKRTDGKLVYGTDSGCSCPTPFEGVAVGDLIEFSSVDELRCAIDAQWPAGEYRGPANPSEVADLLAKVRDALS